MILQVILPKIKRLWDEVDSLYLLTYCICVCTCEEKGKLTQALEDQRLIQFLMGRNNLYVQARGTILMMTALLTIDRAYALLLQDENHREGVVNPSLSPAAAYFMTTGQCRENYKTNNQTKNLEGEKEVRSLVIPLLKNLGNQLKGLIQGKLNTTPI